MWDAALIHTVHRKETGSLDHTTHISIITGYKAYNFKNTHNENYTFQTETCFGLSSVHWHQGILLEETQDIKPTHVHVK